MILNVEVGLRMIRTFEADCEVWQASTSNSISNPGALPFLSAQSIGIDAHILFWARKDNCCEVYISGGYFVSAARSRLASQVISSFHDFSSITPQGIVNHAWVEALFND